MIKNDWGMTSDIRTPDHSSNYKLMKYVFSVVPKSLAQDMCTTIFIIWRFIWVTYEGHQTRCWLPTNDNCLTM